MRRHIRFRCQTVLRPALRGLDRIELTDASGRQQCGAHGGLIRGYQTVNGKSEHIGDHLPPERAAGATAGHDDPLGTRAGVLERRKGIPAGEGDPLHHGAHDIAMIVMRREPEKRPTRPGVHVGRTLADQVGQEQETLCAQGGFCRPARHPLVGACRRQLQHLVTEPAQRHAGDEGGPHLVPPRTLKPRLQGGAKSVRAAGKIGVKGIVRHHDLRAGTQREEHRRRIDDARAEESTRRVPRPGDDWCSRRQTKCFGGVLGDFAGNRARRLHRRQQDAGNLDRVKQVGGPVAPARIEEQRRRAVAGIGRGGPGHPAPDLILWGEQPLRPPPDRGPFFTHPGGRGRHETGHERAAGDLDQPLRTDLRGYLGRLAGRSLIGPDDRGREYPLVLTEKHRAVHLAGEPDTGDRDACARPPDGLLHRGAGCFPPRVRVLLRPAGLRP